ncbi:MAG TPA: hypothetical protein VMH35_21255 [Streptosporangiaceae bacterium]|nr:hypothetical protein [Streptosporangiaceae bacterium]
MTDPTRTHEMLAGAAARAGPGSGSRPVLAVGCYGEQPPAGVQHHRRSGAAAGAAAGAAGYGPVRIRG